MDDRMMELVRHLNDQQSRFVYFLMAIAGACVAFSINQTKNMSPDWSMIVLALAIIAWSGSVFCGIKNREHTMSSIIINVERMKIQGIAVANSKQPTTKDILASNGLSELMEKFSKTASTYWDWQLYLLISGVALYVAWHVIEMFARAAAVTPASP